MSRKIDVEKKRKNEKQTMAVMVEIYCRKKHKSAKGSLCPQCQKLLSYACQRTDRCPFMETKTFCSACKIHCYSKDMQEQVRNVMRFSGPRMLLVHPLPALKHMMNTLQNRRKNDV